MQSNIGLALGIFNSGISKIRSQYGFKKAKFYDFFFPESLSKN